MKRLKSQFVMSLVLHWWIFVSYPSLSLVLPSHQSLPLVDTPHTSMLHHCIPSPLRTNHHLFQLQTPLSFHSACPSPSPTHTLRNPAWWIRLTSSNTLTQAPFHTCTLPGCVGLRNLRGGKRCGAEPRTPGSQAERRGLQAERQNAWRGVEAW